jgi:hypothetical protein
LGCRMDYFGICPECREKEGALDKS